jgi:transcriptional regulator NrdR family protein
MSYPGSRAGASANVGLRCRHCGRGQLRVLYTRRRLDALVRRRQCLHCGTRVTTAERPLGT